MVPERPRNFHKLLDEVSAVRSASAQTASTSRLLHEQRHLNGSSSSLRKPLWLCALRARCAPTSRHVLRIAALEAPGRHGAAPCREQPHEWARHSFERAWAHPRSRCRERYMTRPAPAAAGLGPAPRVFTCDGVLVLWGGPRVATRHAGFGGSIGSLRYAFHREQTVTPPKPTSGLVGSRARRPRVCGAVECHCHQDACLGSGG
jgi:hypothetical protein